MTNLRNTNVTFQDSLYMSEFAELRTANPGNRSDGEFLFDKLPLFFDDISSGGGTAAHQANGRDVLLSVVNTTTGTTAGLRSHYAVPYTPGSGQEIDITFTPDLAAIGGGTAYIFLRSKVTGTVTLETIAQSSWTTLTSGEDWATSHIFRMSFQSLRVGRIQFSIVKNGLPYKIAEITNDNERATGYWQYATLPPYWKLYNDADNTIFEAGYGDEDNGIGFRYVFNGKQATATARAICETVKSQGGDKLFDMPGLSWEADNYTTPITVAATLVPILSIRVASTFNSLANFGIIIPESFEIRTDQPLVYRVFYRPTLTDASFAAIPDSAHVGVEMDVSATAITGGYKIGGGYVTTGGVNQAAVKSTLLGKVIMALGYAGVSDIVSVAAVRTSAQSASAYAAISGREIR